MRFFLMDEFTTEEVRMTDQLLKTAHIASDTAKLVFHGTSHGEQCSLRGEFIIP